MSGLYAAWRLVVQSKTFDPSDVCIVEMSDRIGGRLDTVTFRGGTTGELGGMRFNTGQPLVTELVKRFGLKCLDFPETDNRLYYLRNKQMWQSEMCRRGMLPYNLGRAQQGMTPDELMNYAVGSAIGDPDGWEKWDPTQWQKFVERNQYFSPQFQSVPIYNGVKYSDVGFWDLIHDQLGSEGYRYVTDGGGYDSNTINWNSAMAMPNVASGDYAPGAKYQRIDGGYQKLPQALEKALLDAKVRFRFNTRLIGFSNDNNGMIDCTFTSDRGQIQFKTRYLFLCMPRRSLELLDENTDFCSGMRARHYFASVISQPSFKLLFLYKERWYKNVQIRGQSIKPFGPTITDLPLRMIWYFDPEPSDKYWTLLASYCDMSSVDFWKVMEKSPAPSDFPVVRYPTPEMIEMARSQLQLVHGIAIPEPEEAVFQDWGSDPYGGGYHAWAAHYSPWDMFDRMLHPIETYNVFICGEAYSIDQGWVEGALSTVDTCLLKKLSIKSLSPSMSSVSTSHGLRRL